MGKGPLERWFRRVYPIPQVIETPLLARQEWSPRTPTKVTTAALSDRSTMIKADPALSIQPECKQEVENRSLKPILKYFLRSGL